MRQASCGMPVEGFVVACVAMLLLPGCRVCLWRAWRALHGRTMACSGTGQGAFPTRLGQVHELRGQLLDLRAQLFSAGALDGRGLLQLLHFAGDGCVALLLAAKFARPPLLLVQCLRGRHFRQLS